MEYIVALPVPIEVEAIRAVDRFITERFILVHGFLGVDYIVY